MMIVWVWIAFKKKKVTQMFQLLLKFHVTHSSCNLNVVSELS